MPVRNNITRLETDIVDKQIAQDNDDIIASLRVSAGFLKQEGQRDKLKQLSAGEYNGFSIIVPNSHFYGLGASTELKGITRLNTDCFLSNLAFKGAGNNPSIILNNSVSRLINCTFNKSVQDTPNFIQLVGTSLLILIGCQFIGGPTTGSIVDNPGFASDVQAIGCINRTAYTYGNVTLIGSI